MDLGLVFYLVEEIEEVAVTAEVDRGEGEGAADVDGEAAGWFAAEELEAVALGEAGSAGEEGRLGPEGEGVGRVAGVRDLQREVVAGVVDEEVALLAAVGHASAPGLTGRALAVLVVGLGANHQRVLQVTEVVVPHDGPR